MKIVISISDKNKAKILINMLKDIPYIDNIKVEADKNKRKKPDFKSVFELWKDRDISLNDIRKKAWGKSHK